jgi:hypothetical protein
LDLVKPNEILYKTTKNWVRCKRRDIYWLNFNRSKQKWKLGKVINTIDWFYNFIL